MSVGNVCDNVFAFQIAYDSNCDSYDVVCDESWMCSKMEPSCFSYITRR